MTFIQALKKIASENHPDATDELLKEAELKSLWRMPSAANLLHREVTELFPGLSEAQAIERIRAACNQALARFFAGLDDDHDDRLNEDNSDIGRLN